MDFSKEFNYLEDGCAEAKLAIDKIVALVKRDHCSEDISSGGQRSFYSPEEWLARGEKYGHGSVMIVCHDGGDLAKYFNLDYCCYDAYDRMHEELAEIGMYPEQCTSWYTAIYLRD